MSDAPANALRRSVAGRRWLVAVLVTLVFAALVARETSAAEIAARLRALPLATYVWALVALALAGVPRALRLQLLLPGKLSLGDAYAFNQVYNVVTATIPSGLGEAASAWLMRRALAVPLHLGLVALVVTRFLDLVVLLGLFLLVVLGGLVPLGDGGGTVVAAAAALLAGLASVAALHALGRERVAERLDSLRDRTTRDGMLGRATRRALSLAAEALRLMPDGRRGLQLVALTTVMQLLALLALLVFLQGSGVQVGLAATLACFVIYVLLRLLPLQGIAGIGTTAAWWAIALSMLGVPARDAATVGAVLYVAFYVVMLALSALCLPLLLARRGTP